MSKPHDTSVKVVVRLRPLNNSEKRGNALPVVTASTQRNEVTVVKGISSKATRHAYLFDSVLNEFTSQREVFQASLAPMIKDVLKGFDSTCFAYGQTGTGKTFTMEGNIDEEEQSGIIPRSCTSIFKNINAPGKYVGSSVKISYLEIYNEELTDLLSPKSDGSHLKICEDSSGHVSCLGLSQQEVNNAGEVFEILKVAQKHRSIAETKMNKASSRSHCLFSLLVETKEEVNGGIVVRKGKLHLVDLAGSECAKNTGVNSGTQFRESQNINKSLLTLGRVITALKKGENRIPYRDSKLTRLLQDALGGSNKTCIIATLSPSHLSVDESLSTLKYAEKAQGIKNKQSNASVLMQAGKNDEGSAACDVKTFNEMEQRMLYMQTQCEEAQAALGRKYEEVLALTSRAEEAELQLDTAVRTLSKTEHHLTKARNGNEELLKLMEAEKIASARQGLLLVARQATEPSLLEEANVLLSALDEAATEAETRFEAIQARHAEQERIRQAAIVMKQEAEKAVALLRSASVEFTAGHGVSLDAITTLVTETTSSTTIGFKTLQESSQDMLSEFTASTATAAKQLNADANDASKTSQKALAAHTSSLMMATEIARTETEGSLTDLKGIVTNFSEGEQSIQGWAASTATLLAAAANSMEAKIKAHASSLSTAFTEQGTILSECGDNLSQQAAKLTSLSSTLKEHSTFQQSSLSAVNEHKEAAAARFTAQKELLEAQKEHISCGITTHNKAGAAVRAAHTETLSSLFTTLQADSASLHQALANQADRLGAGKEEFVANSAPAVEAQKELLVAAEQQLLKTGGKQQTELAEQKQMLKNIVSSQDMLGGTANAKSTVDASLEANLMAAQAAGAGQMQLLKQQKEAMNVCITETIQGTAMSTMTNHLESVATFKQMLLSASEQHKGLLQAQKASLEQTMLVHNQENTKAFDNQNQTFAIVQGQVDARNATQRALLQKQKEISSAAALAQKQGREALVSSVMSAMQAMLNTKVSELEEAFTTSIADLVCQTTAMEEEVDGLESEVSSQVASMQQGADQWMTHGKQTFAKMQDISTQNVNVEGEIDTMIASASTMADNLTVEANAWGATDKEIEAVMQAAVDTNDSTTQAVEDGVNATQASTSAMGEQVSAWETINKAAIKMTKQATTKNGNASKTQDTMQKQVTKHTAKMTTAVEAWGASNASVMSLLQEGINMNSEMQSQESEFTTAHQSTVAAAQGENEEHAAVDSKIFASMTSASGNAESLIQLTSSSAEQTSNAFETEGQHLNTIAQHNASAIASVSILRDNNEAMSGVNAQQQTRLASTSVETSSAIDSVATTMANDATSTNAALDAMLESRIPFQNSMQQTATGLGERMSATLSSVDTSVTEAVSSLSTASAAMSKSLSQMASVNSKATIAAHTAASEAQKAIGSSIATQIASQEAWRQGHEQQVEEVASMTTEHAAAAEDNTEALASTVNVFCSEGAKVAEEVPTVEALVTPFFSRHLTTTADDNEVLETASESIQASVKAEMAAFRTQIGAPSLPSTPVVDAGDIAVAIVSVEDEPATTAAGDAIPIEQDKENAVAVTAKKTTSPSQKRKLTQNGEVEKTSKTSARSALKAIDDNTPIEETQTAPKRRKAGSRLRAPSSGIRAPK